MRKTEEKGGDMYRGEEHLRRKRIINQCYDLNTVLLSKYYTALFSDSKVEAFLGCDEQSYDYNKHQEQGNVT